MREIKFRGKRTDNGEMWYGDLSHHTTGKVFIKNIKKGINGTFEVVFNTVGQFTGLYDKNGREIYEGDILYQSFWGKLDDKTPIICKYFNGSFCFTKQDFWDYGNGHEREFGWNVRFSKKRIKKCEIVGNIYDNPELVKE